MRRIPFASVSARSAFATLILGVAALAASAWLISSGRTGVAAALCLAGALLMVAGLRSSEAGSWRGYAGALADAGADVGILGALAWVTRANHRLSASAIAAIGCVFLCAYAETKARALSYKLSPIPWAAPERAALLSAGLAIPDLLEWALWLIAAAMFGAAAWATASVWRQARSASG